MKIWNYIVLIAVVVITALSLLLSACGPIDNSNGNSNKDKNKGGTADKITICHKTGSAKNPYVEISVSANAVTNGHGTHDGDLIPAPEDGCPTTVNNAEDNNGNVDDDADGNASKITICHKTGSAKNPYVEITVSVDATTEGHGTHQGDLIPAPEGGCPTTVQPDIPAK
jgi:hypothetical protein